MSSVYDCVHVTYVCMCKVVDRAVSPHTRTVINTLRPRQNGRHFADDIFKRIFLNENIWIPIKISLKFVPMGSINNIPALAQIMAWRRPGDKTLSEPMMVNLPTHICVTRPQWVNGTTCTTQVTNLWFKTLQFFEDRVPVEEIYGCPIFKWVAKT